MSYNIIFLTFSITIGRKVYRNYRYYKRADRHSLESAFIIRNQRGPHIRIETDEQENRIILKPITREYVHKMRGKFRGKGLLKALMQDKKREREL